MDIIQFIAQFFYRIRYWLLWGGFIVMKIQSASGAVFQ